MLVFYTYTRIFVKKNVLNSMVFRHHQGLVICASVK
jgi:hypothetical protein